MINKNIVNLTKKCPRCRREANIKGFRKNPSIEHKEDICWKCWRQLSYYFKKVKS